MKTIMINTSSAKYDIKLGYGILNKLPEFLEEINLSGKIAIIVDSNVARLHLDKLKKVLGDSQREFKEIIINAGEEYKNLNTVSEIYEKLNEAGITRKDTILAFGGGVTGDISGFCAATYLRGINYIQMPTTLLSIVDSSIGGKTGVDLPCGKNLVGAFKQPKLVVADISFIETLDEEQFASGMSEIIKAGFIRDKELVDKLISSENVKDDIEEFILRAINVKKEVVEIDEFEKYERMLLNFGHTFGHAIEKYYNFKGITHGQAVAFGMYLITKNEDTRKTLEKILRKYNLKAETLVPVNDILLLCKNDKKAVRNGINIVTAEEIGCGKIVKLSFEELGEIYG